MGFMDIITKLIPVIVIILILLILASNIRVVQQSRAYVIERLGAFQTVWGLSLIHILRFLSACLPKVRSNSVWEDSRYSFHPSGNLAQALPKAR